jgi:hypothetical protein
LIQIAIIRHNFNSIIFLDFFNSKIEGIKEKEGEKEGVRAMPANVSVLWSKIINSLAAASIESTLNIDKEFLLNNNNTTTTSAKNSIDVNKITKNETQDENIVDDKSDKNEVRKCLGKC